MPLTPRLAAALRQLQEAGADPVFVVSHRGRHLNGWGVAERFYRIQERAGQEAHGPHRIRHSVATELAEEGLDPYALQALLRHASLETTLEYYVHVNKLKLAQRAIEKLRGLTAQQHQARARMGLLRVVPGERGNGRRGNAVETNPQTGAAPPCA